MSKFPKPVCDAMLVLFYSLFVLDFFVSCEYWILEAEYGVCILRNNERDWVDTSLHLSGMKSSLCISHACGINCRDIMKTRLKRVEAEWRASVLPLKSVGTNGASVNVGTVDLDSVGSTSYMSNDLWTFTGGTALGLAAGTWPNRDDSIRYSYIPFRGNVDAKIRILSFTTDRNEILPGNLLWKNSRVGVMIRETLDANSKHFTTLIQGDGSVRQFSRKATGSYAYDDSDQGWAESFGSNKSNVWLRVKRDGDTFTSFYSEAENPTTEDDWTQLGSGVQFWSTNVDLYVGIGIGASQNDVLEATDFIVNEDRIIGVNAESFQCRTMGYEVCGEFVHEFNRIYEAANETKYPQGHTSPLRRDSQVSIYQIFICVHIHIYTKVVRHYVSCIFLSQQIRLYHQDDESANSSPDFVRALGNAIFPVGYEFEYSDQGKKRLIPGQYRYADLFDDSAQVQFPGPEVELSTGYWTLQQADKHWLRCGVYGDFEVNQLFGTVYGQKYHPHLCRFTRQYGAKERLVSNMSERHPFRCCSDHQSGAFWEDPPPKDSFETRPDCTNKVLRLDKLSGEDFCPVGTFNEAVEFCGRYGGRLCSSMEYLDNCSRNQGFDECENDAKVLWSGFSYRYSSTVGTTTTTCRSSQTNHKLSMKAMRTCDETMQLLVGSKTSVGMVANLADIVNDQTNKNANERLPGYCCMDTALDSQHFGFDVSCAHIVAYPSAAFC